MFDRGAQVKIRETLPEIQARRKKNKSVVQIINPQTLIEDFICVFSESVQREE